MPLMDEFKAEREDMKKAPFKKKAEYFWEYYKWWVIGIVIAVVAIFLTVRSIVTHKADAIYVALINSVEIEGANPQDSIATPFLEEHDISTKKNRIHFNTDLRMNISSSSHVGANTLPDTYTDYVSITNSATARQNLSVFIAAGTVDLMICSENWFDEYGYGSFFLSLDEVLTAEELEKYSDNLYYLDGAVVERYAEAGNKMNYDYDEKFPDPYDLDAMEKPVAMGLIVDESNLIAYNFAFATEAKGDKIVIGVIANGKNPELTHDFIIRLMNK